MSNRRHKILVVEDDLNLRLTLTELLRVQGFAVVTARDGDEGYLQALAHMPDLVITDLQMPILDGIELARLLRHERGKLSGVPIIVLSANLNEFATEKKNISIDRFLDKSFFDSRSLMDSVKSLLGTPSAASAV
ncbi:MAG TPA: response regulator [Blastocatellia bacterium]|nr:response regulator [Blastocatellia bacterium]HMV83848.1 response regulator [Blastocatellia bacterium]HMX27312.1 response regulator [Blastocatellia bacterium]HMY75298.1 response regulator [Blastocatellia bacterium]HMZ18267.1 response regulator [Blastocatellia bacterium]